MEAGFFMSSGDSAPTETVDRRTLANRKRAGIPSQKWDAQLRKRPANARHWTIARIGAGLTQADAARLLNCHPQTLSEVERGVLGAGPNLTAKLDALFPRDDEGDE